MGKNKHVGDEVKMDMTPMIDCVFLLLIFFMCATKFKQVEKRLDCFLPEDEGQMATPTQLKKPEELSIFIKDDHTMRGSSDFQTRAMRRASYFLASRDAQPVSDPLQLFDRLRQLSANPEQAVLIALYDEENDKDQLVPFYNVVKLIDVCKLANINNIKFQAPAQTQ
ncbi:MAG: biopolymer transporter ExbD [Planctomycetota bacterium]|nr:biopolymer transporter ExbD [Planctomycetota bacterium]